MKYILSVLIVVIISCKSKKEEHERHDKQEEKKMMKQTDSNVKKADDKSEEHDHENESEHGEEASGDNEHKESHEHEGEDHAHSENSMIGENKAIVALREDKSFRFSEEAWVSLDIKTLKINAKTFWIDKQSLVSIQNRSAVYWLRDHFFKLYEVRILKQQEEKFLVEVMIDWKEGDQILLSPTGLVRVADIFSKDTSNYSHAH